VQDVKNGRRFQETSVFFPKKAAGFSRIFWEANLQNFSSRSPVNPNGLPGMTNFNQWMQANQR
jgi:hypothetical protein